MARHVIIGGSGFLGSCLARMFARDGEPIVIVDLKPPKELPAGTTFVQADVVDMVSLSTVAMGADSVVHHLASRQYHDRVPACGGLAWFRRVNVVGTRNVLEAMQRGGATRLVFTSTDMVYGLPETVPLPADHPTRPIGPYGASKLEAEELCRSYTKQGIRTVVFRPRLIIGPGRLGVMAKLFGFIRRGWPIPIIGDGSNRYQMVGVEDCAEAIRLAVRADAYGETFNLGSADPTTVREQLEYVIREAGSRSWLLPIPAGLVKRTLAALELLALAPLRREQYGIADCDYVVDIARTQAGLGWNPRQHDNDMVLEGYRWFVQAGRPNG